MIILNPTKTLQKQKSKRYVFACFLFIRTRGGNRNHTPLQLSLKKTKVRSYFNLEDISGFNSAVSIVIPHCSMAASYEA